MSDDVDEVEFDIPGDELQGSWVRKEKYDVLLSQLHKAEERYISLQKKIIEQQSKLDIARELIKRFRQWDVLWNSADRDYWHKTIDETLEKLESK